MGTSTAGLWSVNRLALEFDLDRRTVTRLLRRVRPCGTLQGDPAWRLPVAASVLVPYARQRGSVPAEPAPEPSPTPPGWALLDASESNLDKGYALATLTYAYEIERLAAVLGVDEGLPIAKAFRLALLLRLVMLTILGERAKAWGIRPWAEAENIFDLDLGLEDEAFAHVNWPSLAHKSGDPAWTPPVYTERWVELSVENRAALTAQGLAEEAADDAGRSGNTARVSGES